MRARLSFYLAARYGRREELCAYKADLEARGHDVPARWLLGEHQVYGTEAARAVQAGGPVPAAQAFVFAEDDMEDLLAADVVVNFTEPPRSTASRGGRHVEFGIALGLRRAASAFDDQLRRLFIVGPLENVFHALPEVDGHFDDWDGFLAHLDSQPAQHNYYCNAHPWHRCSIWHDQLSTNAQCRPARRAWRPSSATGEERGECCDVVDAASQPGEVLLVVDPDK